MSPDHNVSKCGAAGAADAAGAAGKAGAVRADNVPYIFIGDRRIMMVKEKEF